MNKIEPTEILAGFFIVFVLVLVIGVGFLDFGFIKAVIHGVVVGLGFVVGSILSNILFLNKD
ncbi:hypothetical protein KQUDLBSD_CDS0020 [Staphylococcus phage PG-2021_40]|nr:hypothetical protein [Mammaliicoccus phage vB_MscM-PMS3]WBF82120.1 hypothetical protein [Mammaliicoccus virus vB_MscM-PMS2]